MDERDLLGDLLGEPGWRAFLKLLDGMAEEQEQKVVTLTVDGGIERLLHTKLRAEGARSLQRDVAKLPEYIRKIEKKDGA